MGPVVRRATLDLLHQRFRGAPVVALLGPRQVGKTTLARQLAAASDSATVFDLEDPRSLARLEHPLSALEPLEGLVVIDEIQRRPELFELLRVLVDREASKTRFLVLGSASPALIADVTETLAGRVSFVDVTGFELDDVGSEHFDSLWSRGGFPRAYLAESDEHSAQWREDFVRTFLERDLPQLGVKVPAPTLRRFWTMLAHWHGQVWNSAEFARSFGVSDPTVRRYLDTLSVAMVVRQLPPWHENLAKRQVKSPKVYVRDSGLLHALLDLRTHEELHSHPKLGASWEGFALEQTLAVTGDRNAYFWATHAGAELDLLWIRGPTRYGFEFKYGDAPRTTRSMQHALADLRLERLFIVHPGRESHVLTERIDALSIRDLPARLRELAAR